jgi:ABC-type hemin transport system substrate-binding protein
VRDALGRLITTETAPRRVVSLVPSETETVAVLAGLDVLVGRTDYCIEPAGAIERVPTVGGTKDFDVQRIVDLAPDLVLANQEENSRVQVEKLIGAGLPVHVSFPQTVAESIAYLEAMGSLLHVDASAQVALAREAAAAVAEATAGSPPVAVFVPIWRDPWMTFDARTYASDVLRCAGAQNVFGERERRYPLAADLGHREPVEAPGRDTRYPRVTEGEIAAGRPEAVWLPDEPYAFGEADREALLALPMPAATSREVSFVDGKELFWYGVRTAPALHSLAARVRALRMRLENRDPAR